MITTKEDNKVCEHRGSILGEGVFITNRASVYASSSERRPRCHARARSWVKASSVLVHIGGLPVSKGTDE